MSGNSIPRHRTAEYEGNHQDCEDNVTIKSSLIRPSFGWQSALKSTLYACAMIGGIVTLFMAIHVVIEVGARNIFNNPLPGTLEITQNWSMVIIVMLAMGYAELTGDHIRAPIFTQKLSPTSLWLSNILVASIALFFIGALTYYSILAAQFSISIQQVSLGSLMIPIWPVKIVLAIGFGLFTLQLLTTLIVLCKDGRPRSSNV
ncbi:TRAP transporter small permease [Rhodococcus sp. H29-C3]|uniref:TRAP transporter small permease subunit n=1 Tax=Rhodococcus sp. H29-C3 TaxID=3046307 RepID=UPI0024B8BC1A|nr:TRAP transporter small permease [Rhodococcus sp. H29-C3]MDJ0359764.1 TRAP transporter small permease [Rhodococcus sp. H29-C3]